MNTKRRKKKDSLKTVQLILLAVAVTVLVVLVVKAYEHTMSIRNDPHYGQVEVFNGEDYIWITPEQGMEINSFKAEDFTTDSDGRPVYTGTEYKAMTGIDVSQYQGDIDWQQVYDSGVRFAIIRAGGRYYGEKGEMYTDDNFEANLEGAKSAGLKVGVYFFSQATSVEEAQEEARYTLELIGDTKLDMPVFCDWERVADPDARTNAVDGATMTDCAAAFCETIEQAGFKAGVYVYPSTGYYGYELSRLKDYTLWCVSIGSHPFFYYAHTLWQYSYEGTVPSIDAKCDMNMLFYN